MKIAASVVGLLAVLTLTGCGRVTMDDPNGLLTPPSASTSPAAPAAPSQAVVTPSSDITRGALLAGLRAVNPAIVTDEDEAVTRSRNVCQKLQGGDDPSAVTTYIRAEFAGGGYAPSQTDALVILSVVRGVLCPA